MGNVFNIFIIIFLIIFFLYLAITSYFVYKYVRNKSREDEIYYYDKIRTLVIIGIFLIIISIMVLIFVYLLEYKKSKNIIQRRVPLFINREEILPYKFIKTTPILMETDKQLLYYFDKMYGALRDGLFLIASEKLNKIIEILENYKDLNQILYLRNILNDYKVIKNLRIIKNKFEKNISKLCDDFDYNPEKILSSLKELKSALEESLVSSMD